MITTPGVHMILYRGENVALIPGEEMQAIQKAVEGPFCVEPHPYLKCGERVRVKRGSLEGVEGVLVRKKNLYRLVLSVNMVAQSVAVEIDAADVEPVMYESEALFQRPANLQERESFIAGESLVQARNLPVGVAEAV